MTSVTTEELKAHGILSGPRDSHHLPEWFREQQRAAWETFQSIRPPVRKDQAWRFASVDLLDLAPYEVGAELSADDRDNVLKYSHGLEKYAARLVFARDQLVASEIVSDDLKKRGVIFKTLEQAITDHPELVRKHFMSQPALLGSAKYAALHKALVSNGTFLFIPRGVEIQHPIEIFHWLRGSSTAVFPHLLLVADELAKVTVIEHFRSCDRHAPGFACGVNDLIAGPGAKVNYVCVQDWGDDVRALQMNTTIVDHDAAALSLNANFGGRYSRFEGLSRLAGEGGRSDMLAISVATGDQEFDARTLQDHASPHTTSDLLYKNALDGRSRSIFGGLIRVEPHAHFTDAYQKVRNLLLSDDAEADSMPGLEILADEVKCSHGATSGQIDENELFYLRSRGISTPAAQRLLVGGFLEEVVRRLKVPAIPELLDSMIEEKFARES